MGPPSGRPAPPPGGRPPRRWWDASKARHARRAGALVPRAAARLLPGRPTGGREKCGRAVRAPRRAFILRQRRFPWPVARGQPKPPAPAWPCRASRLRSRAQGFSRPSRARFAPRAEGLRSLGAPGSARAPARRLRPRGASSPRLPPVRGASDRFAQLIREKSKRIRLLPPARERQHHGHAVRRR